MQLEALHSFIHHSSPASRSWLSCDRTAGDFSFHQKKQLDCLAGQDNNASFLELDKGWIGKKAGGWGLRSH
jgi:hypothetical protein